MPKQILIFLALLCLVSGAVFCADKLGAKNTKTADEVQSADQEEPLIVDKSTNKQEQSAGGIQINEIDTQSGAKASEYGAGNHETAPAPLANQQVITPNKPYGNDGMVVPRDWTIDGTIVGERDKKLLISAGDTVYVDLGSDKVNTGDECVVYRKVGSIKDPKNSGESLGFEVQRVGKLEITGEPGKDVSSAKVTVSYNPLEIGDGVKIISTEDK